ncbi:FUSC family protein [Trinickia fusca]|uniref:FUSC family protein n=1 Tax=Trinickia fusca TaxID=2419777 RepID=A0A494X3I0_9BURK|nr:FUSC family protein [Trinickia fusca]RKP44922.1 FUSC family protein [Trinickia fusca]
MAPPLTSRLRLLVAPLARVLVSPYYRYRNAQRLHAIRVGLAMLVSILVTTGIDVPHGLWASVTVLVVIGGLQHHGNIRKKATDRAIGTLLGALLGLLLIVQMRWLGSAALTYVLMSIIAGICGYYAIGASGYVALLTAITMIIVGGHGDSSIDGGLWRALNVAIGIVIALAFSFALPLYATYSWRYLLARSLRDYAHTYVRLARGAPIDPEAQLAAFAKMGERLVKLRALMASVSKEVDLSVKQLEAIARLNRSLLSALEMMASAALARAEAAGGVRPVREADAGEREVRATLLRLARALRFGSGQPLAAPVDAVPHATPDMGGSEWVSQHFGELVARLYALVAEIEPQWNIERRESPAVRRLESSARARR